MALLNELIGQDTSRLLKKVILTFFNVASSAQVVDAVKRKPRTAATGKGRAEKERSRSS
jgi:hypothetical protein